MLQILLQYGQLTGQSWLPAAEEEPRIIIKTKQLRQAIALAQNRAIITIKVWQFL